MRLLIIFLFGANVVFAQQNQYNTTDVEIFPITSTDESMAETSIYISRQDPNKIICANNSYDINMPSTSNLNLGVFSSVDAGQNWTGDLFFDLDAYADPYCSINNSGTNFVIFIDQGEDKIELLRKRTNDVSWSSPIIVASNTAIDKPHLAIDNRPNKSTGDMFVAMIKSSGTGVNISPVIITKSTDEGDNWSTPIELSNSNANTTVVGGALGGFKYHAPNIAIGPEGNIYVAWAIYDVFGTFNREETAIGFAYSVDGGINWTTDKISYDPNVPFSPNNAQISLPIKGINEPTTVVNNKLGERHPSFPCLAVNQQNGDVYLAWVNKGLTLPNGTNAGSPDINFIKSWDGGNKWTQAIKVNQDNLTNIDQWQMYMTCDPYSGTIAVMYYDSRDFTNNDKTFAYVSVSEDGGSTWLDSKISDVSFGDLRVANSNFATHDYNGIDACNGLIVPIWADTRSTFLSAYAQPFEIDCPVDLQLCDPETPFYVIQKAQNSVTVADNSCNYTAQADSDIRLFSSNFIKLASGFHAEHGSNFRARIQPNCNFSSVHRYAGHESNNGSNKKDQVNSFFKVQPNPIDGDFKVSLRLRESSRVNIQLHDMKGRKIADIVEGQSIKGEMDFNMYFNINNYGIPSGVYFIVLQADKISMMEKIVVE